MKLCRITVEYDGSAFHGWQIQRNGNSVQEELERALLRLTGQAVRVRGAGRTDAGVHARGQVAAFPMPSCIPLEKLCQALNSRLPAAIAVVKAREVSADFDPRRHCLNKQYSYSFVTGPLRPALSSRVWYVKWKLDFDQMRLAAARFCGTYDFSSFCNSERAGMDNVRTVERSEIVVLSPDASGRSRLVYLVEGRSFLYNMVRALAGTLVAVGMGRFRPDDIPKLLAARTRSVAGPSAPAQGLCLEWICYPGDRKPPDRQGLFE